MENNNIYNSDEHPMYNIIWVDDEIDNLCPEFGSSELKRQLKRDKIEIIGRARSFKEFESYMDSCYDRVDAVITDAEFDDVNSTAGNNNFRGLVKITEVIKSYNQRRDIPFYLYTGKKLYLDQNFLFGQLDYFQKNNRLFNKGEYKEMFVQIRKEVEHINSISFFIRKKYGKYLKAASLIEGNEEIIFESLINSYSDNGEIKTNNFTSLREVVEHIFDKCRTLSILPPEITSLNGISKFLNNRIEDKYEPVEGVEIMPAALARALWYFLDITQDASHKKDDLNLNVLKYVSDVQSISLFRSVLHIAMDICLWYEQVRAEAKLPDFSSKWKLKEMYASEKKNSGEEMLDVAKQYYENTLFEPEYDDRLKVWHCEECVIGLKTWKHSNKISLNNLVKNTYPNTKEKYPYYAHFNILEKGIDEAANPTDNN